MGPALSQLRRGVLEYCVLALLRQQERYGFELVRSLSAVDGLVTSEGTIYPLLTRLRKEALVTTFWRESDSGPPRRYYRLTHAGGAALAAFSDDWARFRDGVDALLTHGGSDDHDAA
jgi:PadR family transcriptional regulator PadR